MRQGPNFNTIIDYVETSIGVASIYDYVPYAATARIVDLEAFDDWLHMKMSGCGVSISVSDLKKTFYSEIEYKVRCDHPNMSGKGCEMLEFEIKKVFTVTF